MDFNIIIFANTKWFIEKFKYSFILSILEKNTILCLYLRKGPSSDIEKIDYLKRKGVKFQKLNLQTLFCLFKNQISKNFLDYRKRKSQRIIVFNVGPILISQFIFLFEKNYIIYVLEGLGRIFSSSKIIYRVLKRFIIESYKIIFSNCKKVVTLNYCDAEYLIEKNITTIDKISIIPGTGFDLSNLEFRKFKENYNPIFIDYVGRLVPDKGYIKFLYTKLYLNQHFPEISKNFPFRLITPLSDINLLNSGEINYLKNEGIILKPYISNPMKYYYNTMVLIIPTSYGEGLSRIILEMIHLEIPILSTKNQGTEEILPLNYKYFISSNNPALIANKLLIMLENINECREIISTTKSYIKDRYSSKISNDTFKDFLY